MEIARDLDHLVSNSRVKRSEIVGRGHRDRHDSEIPARAEDPRRNLSAVGHEQLLDGHGGELYGGVDASGQPGYGRRAVIRLLVRLVIALAGNAVGLIVASLVFDGFDIDVTSFILALVIFTIVLALMTPFLASALRRNRSSSSALGGVSLIATFVALLITDLLSDGLSISGIGTWIGATVIVWLASLLAVFILPYLGLKKYLGES